MEQEKDFPPGTLKMTEKTKNLSAGNGGSVASLISHNQDLASRLNVAISRNIQLEKALGRFKKAQHQYEERFQNAKDQVSIYKEKEKFLQNESFTLQEKLQRLTAHLNHEKTEAENTKSELEAEVLSLKSYADGYRKLKERIEKEYIPQRDKLQSEVEEQELNLTSLEKERSELLKKLGETSSHIQTMAQEFKATTAKNTDIQTQKVMALKLKLDQVQNENIVLSDRNRVLRKEQIERTELLNRIEEIKKEKEIAINQIKEEKDNLLFQVSKYTQEKDRLKLENHDLKKQWAKTQADFRAYQQESESSQDEVLSLRALWDDKTSDFSDLESRNKSLNSQIQTYERKIGLVLSTHEETQQRLSFFFEQLGNIYSKQDESQKKATKAMENAFRKAIQPFTDFDQNL